MTPFNVGLFRTQYPEFADTVLYPDQLIELWGNFAQCQVVQCRWGKAWPMGVSLYTAHEVTLEAQSKKSAANGGTPGTFGGVANTKTVGKATIGFDSQSTSEKDGGYWNLTNYGKQFLRLARIYGSGGVQL